MSRTVSIDFETFYRKKDTKEGDACSVATMGNWRYCRDKQFDPFMISAYDGAESWVGETKDFNWDSLEGCHVVAHNASFEESVCDWLAEVGLAPSWLTRNSGAVHFDCTADLTAFICSERDLASAFKYLRHANLSKEERDKMNGVTWAKAKAAGWAPGLLKYCLSDTVECHRIWTDFSPRWSEFERRLSRLTRKQSARGVNINWDLVRKYKQWCEEAVFYIVKSLPWTERGNKPTSTIAIAEECRLMGIAAPPVKSHDEEGFELWVKTYGPKYAWIYNVSDWRKLNKMVTLLERMIERRRPDGTVDFSLLYFGGHTGRWSGGGSGMNMQNWTKDSRVLLFLPNNTGVRMFDNLDVAKKAGHVISEELEEQVNSGTINEVSFPGNITGRFIDMRSLLIPREGKQFIISDLSQIEPRVLNWLAGNKKLLDFIAQKVPGFNKPFSYYEGYMKLCEPTLAAGWSGEPDTIKKYLGGKKYTLLKNKALGLGYQMGSERFEEYAGVTPEEAKIAVDSFRAANPLVVQLWETLDENFRRSLGGDFTMTLPSGRDMVYRNVRRESRHKKGKDGQIEKRTVYRAQTGLDWVELYGGKLTENLVQATARDVFGGHLLELERQSGDVIFHVHDEAIVEVDRGTDPREVEQIMSIAPEWLPGCPVAAEAKVADHYLK